jgi:ribosomal protein L21
VQQAEKKRTDSLSLLIMRRAAAALLVAAARRPPAAAPGSTNPALPALAAAHAARRASSSAAEGAGPAPSTAAKPASPPASGDAALFTVVGRLDGPTPVKPRPVYAVVEISGTQYKVSEGSGRRVGGWQVVARTGGLSCCCCPQPQPFSTFPFSLFFSSQVSPDDLIYTNRLDGADVNDVLHLTRVLAFGTRTATAIGRPTLAAAAVSAAVEEVGRDAKALTFWKRRRKASRRLRGHRQPITALRILDVLEAGVPVLEKNEGGV